MKQPGWLMECFREPRVFFDRGSTGETATHFFGGSMMES